MKMSWPTDRLVCWWSEAGQGVQHSIAEGLISSATNGLPLDEPLMAANMYAKLTPRQVQAAFAKWIRPHDFVQAAEGPNSK